MAITDEITRLQNAKATLKTSLESKGVVVDETATLDTYSTYVDNIVTGEDLTEELNTYETELTEQETTIDTIIETLKNKGVLEPQELNVTPSKDSQVIEGVYNKVNVAGDEDLIPENIKSGVDIFGVTGTGEMSDSVITDAQYLFYNGARTDYLEEILKLCKNVINCHYMFFQAKNVLTIDLSNFNTSNVTDMAGMFYYCYNLESLDISNFDTSNVTNMSSMFASCNKLTSLDLKHFNTEKVTSMQSMFEECRNLATLDISNFDTNLNTSMQKMFKECRKLTTLDISNFDTSNVTSMYYSFSDCVTLQNLNMNGLDAVAVINCSYMFYSCSVLEDLVFMNNLGKGFTQKTNNYSNYTLDLHYSNNLTHESLMDVINKLYDLNLTYDVANGGTLYTQKLVLGSTNLAKLTSEEILIATNKGWVVS